MFLTSPVLSEGAHVISSLVPGRLLIDMRIKAVVATFLLRGGCAFGTFCGLLLDPCTGDRGAFDGGDGACASAGILEWKARLWRGLGGECL